MSVKINGIAPHSHADRCGIKQGEHLVSINGNEIVDVLDYRFYQFYKELTLVICDEMGAQRSLKIKKPEYDELGLLFDTYLMDEQKSCKNKCIFCFIDQLPCGLRDTLYFKDDDSRLSFLFGNYITLTNITEHEIDRIIKMHISPVNVSVHTTNEELRCKMMNNRFAGDALKHLKRLAKSSIEINTQIVCCPGYNDGEELIRTLNDLETLGVNMVAVVPVGLTAHREGLTHLTPFDKEKAAQTIDIVESFAQKCLKKYGRRIAFAADELYIKAERDIPDAEHYEDFPALENGVGLIALLKDELSYALEEYEGETDVKRSLTIACGTSVAPFMRSMMDSVEEKFKNVSVNVVPIKNKFFGGGVNVSGLVVGCDLIDQLKEIDLGDELLISSSMLRFENDLFLDDTSVEDVENNLNIKLTPVNNNGEELLLAVIGKGRELK
ncbi:MAG: DUF512 domain-containing protein [Ruminococcaceae bacterium]|nr:DUF512 domain-containing protein [Oscillospiraceae bacterium]